MATPFTIFKKCAVEFGKKMSAMVKSNGGSATGTSSVDSRKEKNRQSCRESRKKRKLAEMEQQRRLEFLESENIRLEGLIGKTDRLIDELSKLTQEANGLRSKYHSILMASSANPPPSRIDNSSPQLWERRLRNALLDCNLATEPDPSKRAETAKLIYHPNVSIISVGSSSNGIEDALRHKAVLGKVFPDLRFDDIIVSKGGLDGCSVKYVTCGTYNGRPIRYSNVALLSFASGSDLITHKCVNWDAIALLRQLGNSFESFNRTLEVNF
jgi:hypothetical protein